MSRTKYFLLEDDTEILRDLILRHINEYAIYEKDDYLNEKGVAYLKRLRELHNELIWEES